MPRDRLFRLMLAALFAALSIVGAYLRIPLPGGVPLTLQVFFVALCGLLLPPATALISQVLYLALGLIGLPVFSFGGGLQALAAPSFGYILGFAAAAFLISLLIRLRNGWLWQALVLLFALAVVYLLGSFYLWGLGLLNIVPRTGITTLLLANASFLPLDILKLALALWFYRAVSNRLTPLFKTLASD